MNEDQARAAVSRYFEALQRYDIDATVGCFAEDVFYSHPPYAEEPLDAPRHDVHGRSGLTELLRHRGRRTSDHEVQAVACSDDRCFVSGIVRDGSGDVVLSFVSELTLDDEGLISTYAAYASAPAVGAAARHG